MPPYQETEKTNKHHHLTSESGRVRQESVKYYGPLFPDKVACDLRVRKATDLRG